MYKLTASHGLAFSEPMKLSELIRHTCALENAGYSTIHCDMDEDVGWCTVRDLIRADLIIEQEDTGIYFSTDEHNAYED